MTRVKRLTSDGLRLFNEYIEGGPENASRQPPVELLEDSDFSASIEETAHVEKREFADRKDLALYLFGVLKNVDRKVLDNDPGLWSWLALFYFDQICPRDAEGTRKLGKNYRYVLLGKDQDGYDRRCYRHLIAGPYRIYRLGKEAARLLLHGPVSTNGDFTEQLASRKEIISNPAIMKVADELYYSEQQMKPKPGASNRRRPGNVRRMIAFLDQLDLTFDLYSLTPTQLFELLPAEFSPWRSKVVA